MRIVYNQPQSGKSDTTEEHLKRAFMELGHEVVEDGDGDIYLFHKIYNPPKDFTGKKVCWYFDKIDFNWFSARRLEWMAETLRVADMVFMTDETWATKNPNPKITILRQGIGDYRPGIYEERPVDIAFVGNPYGEREEWCLEMLAKYGERFKIYSYKFNRELNDLCASIPIFAVPKYPSDDLYWSNRVYLLVGSGAFLIHPRLKGLEEEWGDNLVYYDDMQDLHKKIKYYLENPKEREEMRKRSYEYCVANFTYKKRCEKLIEYVKASK